MPRRACIAGWPVEHSRSPMIHGYWLKTLKLNGIYDRAPVPPGGFEAFAATIGKDGLVGANVTIPHKEAAFACSDVLTDVASALGAVNTLWREEGKLCGDNTDVEGFLGSLDADAPGWERQTNEAVVLGAGGAARAVIFALLSRGVGKVSVLNRTTGRAEALAKLFGPRVEAFGWSDGASRLKAADAIVNATSLGMKGQPPLELDVALFKPTAVVSDIVYVPLRTALVTEARARGLRAVEGLGMLLNQAAPGFERWFGVRPEVTKELRALVEADILKSQARTP